MGAAAAALREVLAGLVNLALHVIHNDGTHSQCCLPAMQPRVGQSARVRGHDETTAWKPFAHNTSLTSLPPFPPTPCRAPEIYEEQPYSFKSDVWALGCVMYEMMTGRAAFAADNLSRVVLRVGQGARRGPAGAWRGAARWRLWCNGGCGVVADVVRWRV